MARLNALPVLFEMPNADKAVNNFSRLSSFASQGKRNPKSR